MEIKVLDTGCPNCKTLEKATRATVDELGIAATITKKEEYIMKIMEYGGMHTPALVVEWTASFKNELKKLLIN